jgi:AP endonuclease-2
MAYSYTLAERVQNLISMGREVVIVGDLNIAHLPIDHCKNVGVLPRDVHLDEHPARRWLDRFLAPIGELHDVTRDYHPGRKAMYTCWDTIKDTRPANYGARIDYTLVTKGLLPWIKFADIQANVYGSDHCPIYVDFHDEITSEDGTTLKLQDFLKGGDGDGKRKVPSLATSCWPEFSGRRLQSFFAAKPAALPPSISPSPIDTPSTVEPAPSSPAPSIQPVEKRKASLSDVLSPAKKANIAKKATTPKASPGQMKLNTFFTKPKTIDSTDDEVLLPIATPPAPSPESSAKSVLQDSNENDEDPGEGASRVESALAWGSIFARE